MSLLRALLLAALVALASLAPARGAWDHERALNERFVADGVPVVTDYPFTLAAWVTPEVANVTQTIVGVADDSSTIRGVQLGLSSAATATAYAGDASSFNSAATSNTYSAGTRHHVCGIFTSATDRRVVLDGVWASSGTNTTSRVLASLDDFGIGVFPSATPGNNADGIIEHVAVWTVALAQSEVESLAAGAHPYQVQRASLVFYFPGTSQSQRDLAGSVVLTGAPTWAAGSRGLRGLNGR